MVGILAPLWLSGLGCLTPLPAPHEKQADESDVVDVGDVGLREDGDLNNGPGDAHRDTGASVDADAAPSAMDSGQSGGGWC